MIRTTTLGWRWGLPFKQNLFFFFFFAQENAPQPAPCAPLGLMRSSMYHQLWSAAGGLSCRQANHCRLASTAGLASPFLCVMWSLVMRIESARQKFTQVCTRARSPCSKQRPCEICIGNPTTCDTCIGNPTVACLTP